MQRSLSILSYNPSLHHSGYVKGRKAHLYDENTDGGKFLDVHTGSCDSWTRKCTPV